jgi:AraC family transcriptional regulator
MSEAIEIVDVPAQQVLGLRSTGKYEEIPVMLGRLVEHILSSGTEIRGPPVFICHECSPEEVKKANEAGTAELEVAFPVGGRVLESDTIKAYDLPGGRMVRTVHHGPYEECEPTYERLFAWLAEQGLTISGPIREVYPNDPREIPPEEIIMEIYIPVA